MATTITKRTREQAYEHWLRALEGGGYKQGQEELRRYTPDTKSFCCLGVLCDLARKDGGPEWSGITYDGSRSYLSDRIRKFMGIAPREMETLVRMNDMNHASFKTIAKYIRTSLMPRALAR